MRKACACLLLPAALSVDVAFGAATVPDAPRLAPVIRIDAVDMAHATGRRGSRGWEVDRRLHEAGLLADGSAMPALLDPGVYRATFRLRRGRYPDGGLLHAAEQVIRIEVRDASGEVVVSRELDVSEFPTPNRYEDRWIEFSVPPGGTLAASLAAYWHGGINAEMASARVERFDVDAPEILAARSRRLAERIRRDHLENGFVVSRKPDGSPDEIGDATTYTGYYAAALAWRLEQREDERTGDDLAIALGALHNAVKGAPRHPMLVRFVDATGQPHPDTPSKDVYTSFFFAAANAFPRVKDEALRERIRSDVRRIANRLLIDGLAVRGGSTVVTNLAPHFSDEELRVAIDRLTADKGRARSVARAIRRAARYAPFQPLWPGMRDLTRALDRRDEDALYRLALPSVEGVVRLADRVVAVLREHGRQDLLGPGLNRAEPATARLATLIASLLERLPPPVDGRRFRRLSDLRVLASNALISLHVIKTAAVITGDPQFEDYYRNNLYAQDALLKTALDWYGVEDEILRAASGNRNAARDRRGYLALLSAYNLYQLETNPAVKEAYRTIIAREAAMTRHDDNPLAATIAAACGADADTAPLLKALTLYPDSPDGFGDAYWHNNGPRLATELAGGGSKGYAFEPLPVSHRPRDSFLWQRNTRRLAGDLENAYPGADYVFLYWMARRHGLVPAPSADALTVRGK